MVKPRRLFSRVILIMVIWTVITALVKSLKVIHFLSPVKVIAKGNSFRCIRGIRAVVVSLVMVLMTIREDASKLSWDISGVRAFIRVGSKHMLEWECYVSLCNGDVELTVSLSLRLMRVHGITILANDDSGELALV